MICVSTEQRRLTCVALQMNALGVFRAYFSLGSDPLGFLPPERNGEVPNQSRGTILLLNDIPEETFAREWKLGTVEISPEFL